MMTIPPMDMHIDQNQRAIVSFLLHQECQKRGTEPSTDDYTQGHVLDPGDWDTVEIRRTDDRVFDWKAVSRNDVLHTIHQLNQLNLDLKVRLEVDVSPSLCL